MSNIVKRKLKIDGMHCTSCALNIDFNLEDLEGVISAKTNFAKQETEVEFDDKAITLDNILRNIQKTGYKAQEVTRANNNH